MTDDRYERKLRILTDGGPGEGRVPLDMVRTPDNDVTGESALPGVGRLDITARQLRRTNTGVHASIRLTVGETLLAYSTFNVERDEERLRLANSAGRALGDTSKNQIRGPAIKKRLDAFCEKLWEHWVRTDVGWYVTPNMGAKPRWLLEPYLIEGGGTILYGPPGSTKSWVSLLWSVGLSEPWTLPWTADEQRKVLFVNLERSAESIGWRLACVGRTLNIGNPKLLALNARGRTLHDLGDAVMRTVQDHKPDLVVVDSLSRTGTGNLNDNEDSNRAMDALNAFGVAWCVLGHTPRGDTSHVYGSIMQEAAADLCVRLSSVSGEDNPDVGVQLEVTKANDVPKAKAAVWTLSFDDDGLKGVRAADPNEWPDLLPVQVTARKDVESFLLTTGTATVSEIVEETGVSRSKLYTMLADKTRFVRIPDPAGGRGKKARYGLAANVTEAGA